MSSPASSSGPGTASSTLKANAGPPHNHSGRVSGNGASANVCPRNPASASCGAASSKAPDRWLPASCRKRAALAASLPSKASRQSRPSVAASGRCGVSRSLLA
ncbi:MAG TPA: hypothetical protein VJ463_02890 [Geothrix sp.]|nr:hypothetical protein [Geothrix sp.]